MKELINNVVYIITMFWADDYPYIEDSDFGRQRIGVYGTLEKAREAFRKLIAKEFYLDFLTIPENPEFDDEGSFYIGEVEEPTGCGYGSFMSYSYYLEKVKLE